METTVHSIRDSESCNRAATLLKDGYPIGSYLRGVCGLWTDGQNNRGLDTLYRIKGADRGERPVGTTLTAARFTGMLDADRIAPSARNLMLEANELAGRLGSLCFIRAPIRREVGESLPSRLVSIGRDEGYWLQNWLPEGSRAAAPWIQAIGAQDIGLPVATSMNVSGEPELVEPEEGLRFCRQHGVPALLVDKRSPKRAKGSFPILGVDSKGISLIREGHFPARLFQTLLKGWEINLSDFVPAKYPLVDLPQKVDNDSANPAQIRSRLLDFLDGPR